MKALALESVVKWIILLVAAVIIINLMLFFYDEIKRYLERIVSSKKEWKTEIIEAERFSTGQLIAYIKACWARTGERFHEDVVCFILKGDVSGVDPASLDNVLEPPAQVDRSRFNPAKNVTIIRFVDLGNVVVVES